MHSSTNENHVQTAPSVRRIAVFGFDVTEVSQIRRIRALRNLGHEVISFTMRRANMNTGFVPEWPNVHLFYTENEKILRRAVVVAASMMKMAAHRAALRRADLIIARNLDMLAIAWAARKLARAEHVPLVYECLDIHDAMTGQGAKSRAMRWAERMLLDACALLVVSSPGFMRQYFAVMQGYVGPWELWENKLVSNGRLPERPMHSDRPAGDRLRLGWIGTIRCAPSMAILAETAKRMEGQLDLHIHGVVHRHAVPEFDPMVAAHSNVIYHGPYTYPEDLPRIYGGCDLVWAQDLWQRGRNSDWLLPNRIYEAPWCGCLSIALADTETGRRVVEDGLGWVVDRADAETLITCLRGLATDEIRKCSQELLHRPEANFVQTGSDLSRVVDRAIALGRDREGGAA